MKIHIACIIEKIMYVKLSILKLDLDYLMGTGIGYVLRQECISLGD